MAVLQLDPYRALELVQRTISKNDNLILKKRNTVTITPKDLSKGPQIAKLIINEISRRYPSTEIKQTTDGGVLKLKAIVNGYGSIHISVPRKTTSPIMKPGEAYELYFESVILGGLKNLKELREEMDIPQSMFDMYHNLTLVINAGNKKISIGPIKSVDKVGQLGGKTDIRINLKTGRSVKISLKQGNFAFWSSAGTFDSTYSVRPKKILDKSISIGQVSVGTDNEIIFPTGVNGLRVPANESEIKKYAFGTGADVVDYIIVNAGQVNYNSNTNVIYMTGMQIYKKNDSSDIRKMMNDFYMMIYRINGTASALRPYKNVSVRYANKNHAYNALDGSKYIDAAS